MDLQQRLRSLRTQTGAVADRSDAAGLRDRLARLAPRRVAAPGPLPDAQVLADHVGGQVIETGCILVEQRLADGYGHGDLRLDAAMQAALMPFAAPTTRGADRIVYLDTETTGLSGGSGTLVFQVGIAWFESTWLRIRQYLISAYAGEAAMLARLAADLAGAQLLVSFNGKSFDVPLLTSRFRMQRQADPFTGMQHVDLLPPLRRAFTGLWADCRLQSAERRLLGLRRHRDLPGAEAPAAWIAWLQRRQPQALREVLAHNRLDTLSLVALPTALAATYRDPPAHGANLAAIARYHCQRGRTRQAYELLNAHAEQLDAAALMELARLAWQRQRIDQALRIWQDLADRDDIAALETLAKYAEHGRRDLAAALAYTRRLLAADPASAQHRHRFQRLVRRCAQRGADTVATSHNRAGAEFENTV